MKVLGLDGSKVQCSVCKNQWYQRRDKLMELDPAVDELEDFPESERERFKRSSPSRGGYNGGGRPSGQFYTAFVGNLSFNTTREEVRIKPTQTCNSQCKISIAFSELYVARCGYVPIQHLPQTFLSSRIALPRVRESPGHYSLRSLCL